MPKYLEIYDDIKRRIVNGEYPVGKRIPSAESMEAVYDCSRGPILKAIDLLATEGILQKQQGKETLVIKAPAKPKKKNRPTRLPVPKNNATMATGVWVRVGDSPYWGLKDHLDQGWATTVFHEDDPAWNGEHYGFLPSDDDPQLP